MLPNQVFHRIESCNWHAYDEKVHEYIEHAAAAHKACTAYFGEAAMWWFPEPTALGDLAVPLINKNADRIKNGWFTHKQIADVAFHFSDSGGGRLDAFFTSPAAAAKFSVRRREGALSHHLLGFCITTDLTKTSAFPHTDGSYWMSAFKVITTLDAMCLVVSNRTVTDLAEAARGGALVDEGGDYLGAWWDAPKEIGAPLTMAIAAHIVRASTTRGGADSDAISFAEAKRLRLAVTLNQIIWLNKTLNASTSYAQLSRDAEVAARLCLSEVEHCTSTACAAYYFGEAVPPELSHCLTAFLRDTHRAIDAARIVAHPGAPVPLQSDGDADGGYDDDNDYEEDDCMDYCEEEEEGGVEEADGDWVTDEESIEDEDESEDEAAAPPLPPQSAGDGSFLPAPLHTIGYTAVPPTADLRSFDVPSAAQFATCAPVDDWYAVRNKARAVLAYAQQLYHAPSMHVGNGKRLAFEVIAQFALETLPMPLPRRGRLSGNANEAEAGADAGAQGDLQRHCFWFEPRGADGQPVAAYDESIRKDLLDLIYQLTYIVKMCPQAAKGGGGGAHSGEEGGGDDGDDTTTEAANNERAPNDGAGAVVDSSQNSSPSMLSSVALLVLSSLLAVADAVMRVLLPRDLEALARIAARGTDGTFGVDDEGDGAPLPLLDVTRALNGIPWGGGASGASAVLDGTVAVPSVAVLLRPMALNLAAPHLFAHARACHAYFSSIAPDAALEAILGRRLEVAQMGESDVRRFIASATAPFYCDYTSRIKKLRPGLFPQTGTACAQYWVLLDNCYAALSGREAASYLPAYTAVECGNGSSGPPAMGASGAVASPLPLVKGRGFALATEMDVLHVAELLDDPSCAVDAVERVAAAATERAVSLRVVLSILASTPRLLESRPVFGLVSLLLSASPGLCGSPQAQVASPAEHGEASVGVDHVAVGAAPNASHCGLLVEELTAFPEEAFAVLHRLLREAVLCAHGAYDARRARMFSRVVMVATQAVAASIFILEADPVDTALACPCTYVDGITGAHRPRRAALSAQAKHLLGLLLCVALPRLSALIAQRESMPKPTAELFPEKLKLETAIADFQERRGDLCHLHAAVAATVALIAHNQSALWLTPASVAAPLPPHVTMRSSMDLFWPPHVLAALFDQPIAAAEAEAEAGAEGGMDAESFSSISFGDVMIAGAGSCAFLQNADWLSAVDINSADATAVDFVGRAVRQMLQLSAMAVRAAQSAVAAPAKMAAVVPVPAATPIAAVAVVESREANEAAKAAEERQAAGQVVPEAVPAPAVAAAPEAHTAEADEKKKQQQQQEVVAASAAAFASNIANETVCTVRVLGFVLRDETGDLIAKERRLFARFLRLGGRWAADPAAGRRGRFLFSPQINRSLVGMADADVLDVLTASVNVAAARPTLPVTSTVLLKSAVELCLPRPMVADLLASGAPLCCAVPEIATAEAGAAVTKILRMGLLVIHSSPPVVTDGYAALPKVHGLPSHLENFTKQLAGPPRKVEGSKNEKSITIGGSCDTRNGTRVELTGSTDALGTFVADVHSGTRYFSRPSAVVSVMRRMGDVAFSEPVSSTNIMFRSTAPFSAIRMEDVYVPDGEAYLRDLYEKECARRKKKQKDAEVPEFEDVPASERPTTSAVAWPSCAYDDNAVVSSLVRGEERSASISRPLPEWIARAVEWRRGGPSRKYSPLFELLLPTAAVRSMVPSALCESHVWFMLTTRNATLHCASSSSSHHSTMDDGRGTCVIHGYPAPAAASLLRLGHVLNWLEHHLFAIADSPLDFSFIRIAVDAGAMRSVVSRVVVSGATSSCGDRRAKATEGSSDGDEESAEKGSSTTGDSDADTDSSSSSASSSPQKQRQCRTDAVLVSPYAPSLGLPTQRLFAQLCRLCPLNEVEAWRSAGANPNPKQRQQRRDVDDGDASSDGGYSDNVLSFDDAPDTVAIHCAHLTFAREPTSAPPPRPTSDGVSITTPLRYECRQYADFVLDVSLSPSEALQIAPSILHPFIRGDVPCGVVLRGRAPGRFALLLPVLDAANGHSTVALVHLTPSGDDFVPPSPEAAACLLMCLYRYTLSPMRAVPAVRAAFVNAGHFSRTQAAFLRAFIADLAKNINYGPSHRVIEELRLACPTYATALGVHSIDDDKTSDFVRRYAIQTARTVRPALRMAVGELLPRLPAAVPTQPWEREAFLDSVGLLLRPADAAVCADAYRCFSVTHREAFPFGDHSTSQSRYWHLHAPRYSSVDGHWDDMGHHQLVGRTSVTSPSCGDNIGFLTCASHSAATTAGLLKLRVAFTNEALPFAFHTLRRALTFRTNAEAAAAGRVLRSLTVESFVHRWETTEVRRWQERYWDPIGECHRNKHMSENYQQSHSRTAYKNKSAMAALEHSVSTFRGTPEWVSPPVATTYVATVSEGGRSTMSLPRSSPLQFIDMSHAASLAAGKVTVAFSAARAAAVQPFGGAVEGALAAFDNAASAIGTFDSLTYGIDESDDVAKRAVAKQNRGLVAFSNAQQAALATTRTCAGDRQKAFGRFSRLCAAVEERFSQMQRLCRETRAAMFTSELSKVFPTAREELNPLTAADAWVSTGAMLRHAMGLGVGGGIGAEMRTTVFAHLFASHAAEALADLLWQLRAFVRSLAARCRAGGAPSSPMTPSEVEAGDALLRAASLRRVFAAVSAAVDSASSSDDDGPLPTAAVPRGAASSSGVSRVTFDPLCLYFEWLDRKLLRGTQHELLCNIEAALRHAMGSGESPSAAAAAAAEVHQLLMGEGKSSVVIPLLALRLAAAGGLLVVSCPAPLVRAAERNLAATTLGPLTRDVMLLVVNREKDLMAKDVMALKAMRARGGVVLAAPNTLKCVFSLNPLDIANPSSVALNTPTGFGTPPLPVPSCPRAPLLPFYAEAVQVLRQAPIVLDEVDDTCDPLRSSLIFPCGTKTALDGADMRWRLPTLLLHALHACGGVVAAEAASAAPPTDADLLQALPFELRGNAASVDDVRGLIAGLRRGLEAKHITLAPHLMLTTPKAFEHHLLRPLAPIAASLVALPSIGSTAAPRRVIERLIAATAGRRLDFGTAGTVTSVSASDAVAAAAEKGPIANERLKAAEEGMAAAAAAAPKHADPNASGAAVVDDRGDEDAVALEEAFAALSPHGRAAVNLAAEWLFSLLPHVLRKQHRVQFGVVTIPDQDYLKGRAIEAGQDATIQLARTILAIPFEGKDQPSLSSEFSHPDVVIGLTITAHILTPLVRDRDAGSLVRRLKVELSEDSAPMEQRDAYRRHLSFMREGLCRIFAARGAVSRSLYRRLVETFFGADFSSGSGAAAVEVPLPLSEDTISEMLEYLGAGLDRVSDSPQGAADIYEVLRSSVGAACYFCVYISAEHLRLNPYTFTACGGDLLSANTFTHRVGFSGTPSDLIPHEVAKGCQEQAESEGKASSVLLCPRTTALFVVGGGGGSAAAAASASSSASPSAQLARLLGADAPVRGSIEAQVGEALLSSAGPFNAIIDVGAMLTQTNEEVARWLLRILPHTIKGCVFFRRDDTKVALLRDSGRVVPLEVAGLRREEQFVFYDQVHTRGQDIRHHPAARALVLLGMKADLDLNALSQGVFRMRGLGSGQTLTLLVTEEVAAAVRSLRKTGAIRRIASSSPAIANANTADDHVNDPIANKDIHAWALNNLLQQTRVSRVALRFENARRLLLKAFLNSCSSPDNRVEYRPYMAFRLRDPVGFRLPTDFAPKHPTLHQSCTELRNRFLEGQGAFMPVDTFAEADAYIAGLKAEEEGRQQQAASEGVDGVEGAPRQLEALMEKDQQEHKVREREVAKMVNVQGSFDRSGERYIPWGLADAASALFGGAVAVGAAPSPILHPAVAAAVAKTAHGAAKEKEKEEESKSRAPLFRSAAAHLAAAIGVPLAKGNGADGSAEGYNTACQLFFSPNFCPYDDQTPAAAAAAASDLNDGFATIHSSRRLRPLNFVLEMVAVGKPSSSNNGDGEPAMESADVRFPAAAVNVMRAGGSNSDGNSNDEAALVGALASFGSPPVGELASPRQTFAARRFVAVTLAEAAGIRRALEAANRLSGRGPIVAGFAFALRDFNHWLAPAYTEQAAYGDNLPSDPFNTLHALLNFIDGSPLFSVLRPRARVDRSPRLLPLLLSSRGPRHQQQRQQHAGEEEEGGASAFDGAAPPSATADGADASEPSSPTTALAAAATAALRTVAPPLFLKESSAAYAILKWLPALAHKGWARCFGLLTKELRRPDAAKLDWRLHCGATFVLRTAGGPADVLLARAVATKVLLGAARRGDGLAKLQSALDPHLCGSVSEAALRSFLAGPHGLGFGKDGEGDEGGALALTSAQVALVARILDYDADGTISYGDLQRAVVGSAEAFPDFFAVKTAQTL